MLCGYRGAGKDHTYRLLQSGEKLEKYWKVYYHNLRTNTARVRVHFNSGLLHHRVAFADALKLETAGRFEICPQLLEKSKDMRLETSFREKYPQLPPEVTCYRRLLCMVGNEARTLDQNHWTVQASKFIRNDRLNVVTDFRLPTEILLGKFVGMRPLTVRVVRGENSIPQIDLPLEHELDDYPTDLLLTDIPLKMLEKLHSPFEWTEHIPHYTRMRGI